MEKKERETESNPTGQKKLFVDYDDVFGFVPDKDIWIFGDRIPPCRVHPKGMYVRWSDMVKAMQAIGNARVIENQRFRTALESIEQMPWPNSASPYALISREALDAPSVPDGLKSQSASGNPKSA